MGGSTVTGCTPSISTRLCTGHVPSRRSLIPKHQWKHQRSFWFETSRWVTQHKTYSAHCRSHCSQNGNHTASLESKVFSACLSLVNDLILFHHNVTGHNNRPDHATPCQDKDISSHWKIWICGTWRDALPFTSSREERFKCFLSDSHIFRAGVAREHSVLESHWADGWLVLHQSAPGVKRGAVLAEEMEEGLVWSSRAR